MDKIEGAYKIGRSCLLLGKPYESLSFYAKALQESLNEPVIEAAIDSIDKVAVRNKLLSHDWVKKLLLIGLVSKFPTTAAGSAALEQIKKLASRNYQSFEGPIVIVGGGCSSEVETQMRSYQGLLLDAFRNFWGTIISGGTTSGISGIIGEVQHEYPNKIRTVGYVPSNKTDLIDTRYSEIRFTSGGEFSPIEPLQYWIDIFASGINSEDVKLLGINGGRISALEYRMALAFGARVAIVQGSGKEAETLPLDNDWKNATNLFPVPNDSRTVQLFIEK
jgi:hypothetical protein